MQVLYIAGPYRSKEGIWGVAQNIEKARRIARKYWLAGYAVICPHANTAFMDSSDGATDEMFLAGDIEMLGRCNGIVMVPGWEQSAGARAEHDKAKGWGMQVIYEEDA
jgi:dienelactone hydrolase